MIINSAISQLGSTTLVKKQIYRLKKNMVEEDKIAYLAPLYIIEAHMKSGRITNSLEI